MLFKCPRVITTPRLMIVGPRAGPSSTPHPSRPPASVREWIPSTWPSPVVSTLACHVRLNSYKLVLTIRLSIRDGLVVTRVKKHRCSNHLVFFFSSFLVERYSILTGDIQYGWCVARRLPTLWRSFSSINSLGPRKIYTVEAVITRHYGCRKYGNGCRRTVGRIKLGGSRNPIREHYVTINRS
jgi:hypothetical protein